MFVFTERSMKKARKFEEKGNHSFKSFSNTLIRAASCLFHVLKKLSVLQWPYISRGPSHLITYLQRWQSSNILFYLNSHFSICLELFDRTTLGSQSQPSSLYKFHNNRNFPTLLRRVEVCLQSQCLLPAVSSSLLPLWNQVHNTYSIFF